MFVRLLSAFIFAATAATTLSTAYLARATGRDPRLADRS